MFATALAALVALLPLASPAARLPPAGSDLRGTSLVLVEGINGGIAPASRHRVVVFGYDWNRCGFRAVERRIEGRPAATARVFRAVDLEGDRFRRLVEEVVELGLPSLPLEEPAGCEDLYGRDTGIRFLHAAGVWENRAPGCVVGRSSVRVTAQQIVSFDAVVALVNRTLAEGSPQPASELDWLPAREWNDLEIRTLSKAVDLLRERGLAGKVDANAAALVGVVQGRLNLRLPCRSAQPFYSEFGQAVVPIGWWDLSFTPGGEHIEDVRETPVPGETDADVARRAAFVAAHPELSAPQRELILAGWVGDRMSEAMVRAAWGDPLARSQSARDTDLQYSRGGGAPPLSYVTLRLCDDRLIPRW
ncbi:MAG: hypothetical protein ABI054_12685 [Planctomycetota bacterium]